MSGVILMQNVFDSCPKLKDIVIEHEQYQNEFIPIPASKKESFTWVLMSQVDNYEVKQYQKEEICWGFLIH